MSSVSPGYVDAEMIKFWHYDPELDRSHRRDKWMYLQAKLIKKIDPAGPAPMTAT